MCFYPTFSNHGEAGRQGYDDKGVSARAQKHGGKGEVLISSPSLWLMSESESGGEKGK